MKNTTKTCVAVGLGLAVLALTGCGSSVGNGPYPASAERNNAWFEKHHNKDLKEAHWCQRTSRMLKSEYRKDRHSVSKSTLRRVGRDCRARCLRAVRGRP